MNGLTRNGGFQKGNLNFKNMWRDRVLDALNTFKEPVSSRDIYEFLLIKYAFKDGHNKRTSVSATLSILNRRGKLTAVQDYSKKHFPTLYKLRD